MRIAVVGAGAVGAYFGGRLAQAGEDVVFVTRPQAVDHLRANGLRIESVAGDFEVQPKVTANPGELGHVDAVLVAVKSWQVREAAQSIRSLVGDETIVVPLQNGVEAPEHLIAALGKRAVLGGVCRIISAVIEPGLIRHSGIEPSVTFGELSGGPCARGVPLRDGFRRAGVAAEISADVTSSMWQKFLFLVAWGGVGSVTRMDIGTIRSTAETRELLVAAMHEIAAVARARSVRLPDDAVTAAMHFIDRSPAHGTTSMQRDMAAGRASELEQQTGAVVRFGRLGAVPVPVHEFLYASLLPTEVQARRCMA